MSDPLFDLEGRIAIVTGGMGQLGQVYLAGLAERGMRVASFDVVDTTVPEGGLAFRVDVTDRSSIERGLADVVSEWGVPHLLVNNAALDSPPDAPAEEVGPFEEYPETSFDAVMDVNVKGTFLCCQAVGAAMAREGRGSIVNVSSVYGLLSPVQDLYAFRIERNPHHLGFGIGSHFCMGANLARMEMRVVFEEILRRLPDMEYAGDGPVIRPSALVRTCEEMKVRYTPEGQIADAA